MNKKTVRTLAWPVALLVLFSVGLASSVYELAGNPRAWRHWWHLALFTWAAGEQLQRIIPHLKRNNPQSNPETDES